MAKASTRDPLKVVLTGAESTGKSTLARELAAYYKTSFLPEYSRAYIENLHRQYTYEDVLHIAELQLNMEFDLMQEDKKVIIFDTSFIIIKVWLEEVYGKCPPWIDLQLSKNKDTIWLLCDTDLPWVPDKTRENGDQRRLLLQQKYLNILETFKFKYHLISGKNEIRLQNAIFAINKYL